MVLWRILVYLFSNKIQWDNLCFFFWHFYDLLKFFPKAPVKSFSQRTAAKFNFSLHLHNISIHLPHCVWESVENIQKSFCVTGAILLRGSLNISCIFRGRRSTLEVSMFILRGTRSTLDVSCCVFFANRIGGLSEVVTPRKLRGIHGTLWHVMKIDGSLARNTDFEVADFGVHQELVGTCRFCSSDMRKVGEVSHMTCV